MLKAIKHGLSGLVNFAGRDARQAFWYYVLFVYLVMMGITMIVTVPMMLQGFMSAIQAASVASQSSDPLAAQAAVDAAMLGSISGSMETMAWMGSVTNVVMMALLAASLVRRLHDSDLSGWWALLPGAVQVANLFLAPELMRRLMEGFGRLETLDPAAGMRSLQTTMGMVSLLGWGAIAIVVILGIRQSTPGPNRYGETPFIA